MLNSTNKSSSSSVEEAGTIEVALTCRRLRNNDVLPLRTQSASRNVPPELDPQLLSRRCFGLLSNLELGTKMLAPKDPNF